MKRFTFGFIDGVKILKDGDKLLPDVKALELLNSLSEENEQLKSEIKDLNDILARYEEKEFKE